MCLIRQTLLGNIESNVHIIPFVLFGIALHSFSPVELVELWFAFSIQQQLFNIEWFQWIVVLVAWIAVSAQQTVPLTSSFILIITLIPTRSMYHSLPLYFYFIQMDHINDVVKTMYLFIHFRVAYRCGEDSHEVTTEPSKSQYFKQM